MKCADPILCFTDGKTKQYRHYSLASPLFRTTAQLVFDCRKCPFCRKKQSRELAMRCVLNASLYSTNCFITLTYDEKKESYHNNFQYLDIQKFKKSLRRYCDYHHNKKIQIFNVHEYGKNGKKHWHLVVFNHDFQDKELFSVKSDNRLYTSKTLESLWPHGFNTIGDVTEASAMYQAQYMNKDLKNGNTLNERKSHSKHSGIGRDYFLQHYEQILTLGYIPFNTSKLPIPRYFQKLAHKHYCHYYEPSAFHDTLNRKKLYTLFKNLDEPNQHMAELYRFYKSQKEKHIEQLETEWETFIEEQAFSKEKPDFKKSEENYLHDLKNRQNINTF